MDEVGIHILRCEVEVHNATAAYERLPRDIEWATAVFLGLAAVLNCARDAEDKQLAGLEDDFYAGRREGFRGGAGDG